MAKARGILADISMNTRITYLYRDASNYKQVNDAIVAGVMTEEQEQIILNCLEDGEYFIPSQVGLPETRFSSITEDDHCWFELTKGFASTTENDPDVYMTVHELVQQFVAKKGQWDDSETFQSEF